MNAEKEGETISHSTFNIQHSTFRASEYVLLCGVAAFFVVGVSVLSWGNGQTRDLAPRFHWPDETSNSFFAERIARGESFIVSEERNIGTGNIVHPRTVNVRDDGALVPGSYLGLPLWYGIIGRAFGVRAMLFITPIIAALGFLAFAYIVRRIMDTRIALISTMILLFHPSVWFFTATAFLPNIPFVALLLMGFVVLSLHSSSRGDAEGSRIHVLHTHGVRFLARLGMTGGVGHWLLSGLFLGFALTLRTHEALWIGALVVGMVWFQARGKTGNARWVAIGYRLSAIGSGIALPFIPILILNTQLYGSPFVTGYSLLQEGGALPTEFSSDGSFIPPIIRAFVAPFGWYPVRALMFAWQYLVVPYWWFAGLVAIGMIAGRYRRALLVGTLAITAWLVIFYGSWLLADPLVRATNIFTISYVRYWLPIIIVCTPWAAMGFEWLVTRVRVSWRPYFAMTLMLAIAGSTFQQIVNDPTEGIHRQWSALQEHRVRARAVIVATEQNAIIVSDRMDKVFFPDRATIHASAETARDQEFIRNLRKLVERAPVYWYSPSVVSTSEFRLTEVDGAPYGERLYRVNNL